jgi:hypothetical protein
MDTICRKHSTLFLFVSPLVVAIWGALVQASRLTAEQVPVRHLEGVTFGFLVLRSLNGGVLAYGDLKSGGEWRGRAAGG